MSETPTSHQEQSLDHEVSAMADLNIATKRVFTSYIANREGYEVSTSQSPEADQVRILSTASGSSISRSTDQEGHVSYELTTLWTTDADKGSSTFRWDGVRPELTHEYTSDTQGSLGQEYGSGVTMEHARELTEREFPVRVEAMPAAKKTPFERLMGGIILRRAKKATAPVVVER